MIAWKERMKDGRHVGLDFYDLLIEPIFVHNVRMLPLSGYADQPDVGDGGQATPSRR